MAVIMNVEKFGLKSKFLGLEIHKQSHEELGLQIADLVAGEVRRFFRYNPDLLAYGSGLTLITFGHQDDEEAVFDQFGKNGRRVRIPPTILKKALTPTENCALPYLRSVLAAGLVTCVTDFGTLRDVGLFDGYFLDLCD